ncbi:MAG TPA: HEAT repeat domain-containing protein [Chloroflexia bacterium]|nr:HEAT repeat domain-containing protein [Chloroflexia bacterium]
MVASIRHLVELLSDDDFDVAANALDKLVHHGRAATPALLDALKSDNDRVRVLVAEGLEAIADPASADGLFAALDDPNGQVRAQAASALTRMEDPRAIDALVRTIDDFEDILHSPYTLSTYNLMAWGPEVLPAVAPLLKSDNPMTRMRAFEVFKSIAPKIPNGDTGKEQIKDLLDDYKPEAPASERDPIAARLVKAIGQPKKEERPRRER